MRGRDLGAADRALAWLGELVIARVAEADMTARLVEHGLLVVVARDTL
jgi:hypothetical protein